MPARPAARINLRSGFRRLLTSLLVLLTVIGVLGACAPFGDGPMGRSDRGTYESNGERIYFSAESASGDRISSEGGPDSGMMRNHFACADCHGDDGQGGRVRIMMQSFVAPPITWDTLTEDHEGHGDAEHPPYTQETVKRAIREGVDPAGKRLDSRMPRWEVSGQDMDDLIDFLKSLDGDGDHEDEH